MPQLGIDPNTLMTPNRVTRLELDLPESMLLQPRWGKVRRGGEVAKPAVLGKASIDQFLGMHFWSKPQIWTLKPVQADINRFHEYGTASGAIITLDRWNAVLYNSGAGITGLVQENIWRRPDDMQDASSMVQVATGDPFIQKMVFESWTAEIASAIKAVLPAPKDSLLLDRVCESDDLFRAEQGFFIRWSVPGTIKHNPDAIWNFYFGQYMIEFDGSGRAFLHEHIPTLDGLGAWPVRHFWRYAKPSEICETAHTLAIWPYRDMRGRRFIVFANNSLDAVGTATGFERNDFNSDSQAESVYAVDSGIRTTPDQSPGFATAPGHLRIDIRRDLKVKFQISTLQWATSGTLIDLPDSLPPMNHALTPVVVTPYKLEPDGAHTISAAVFDAGTGLAFVPGTDRKPFVKFTFAGDGSDTPLLYGYKITRDGVAQTITPGAFTCTNIKSVNLDAFDGELTSQAGSVVVDDRKAEWPRLRNRGKFSARLYTTFTPPAEAPVEVNLHRGRVVRPKAKKKGKPGRTQVNGAGATVPLNFPSPDWRQYTLSLFGHWERLTERVETTWHRIYAIDESAPLDPVTKTRPPYKVTTIIRELLYAAGYPPGMVNIPDLPYRLWPGEQGLKEDDYHVKPAQGYAEIIQRLARNYLGAWLYFEENAGTDGQWMLLFASKSTTPTVATFVTTQADPLKPPHLLGAYPPNTYPVLVPDEGLDEDVVPPEFNFVYVSTSIPLTDTGGEIAISNYKHNPKSFAAPGFDDLSDPDDPDWLGYCRPLVIVNPALAGAGFGAYSAAQVTQMAVNWETLRLYDFLCHAQRLVRFPAPLAFVKDAAIGNRWRRIRFQDPVLLNEDRYYIKGVSAEYVQDGSQMATYELIDPLPGKM